MSIKSYDSTENIISVFVESLSDPLHPAYCCKFYNNLLLFINYPTFWAIRNSIKIADPGLCRTLVNRPDLARPYLHSHFHGLFAACMTFLTVTRSREGMRELKDRMECCTCDRTDPVSELLHSVKLINLPPPPEDDITGQLAIASLKSLVLSMSLLLRAAILEYCPADLKGIKKARKNVARGKQVPWPTTPQEILGIDIAPKVTMLCRWLDEYPALKTLNLLQAVAFKCGRDAVISMLRSATLGKHLVDLLDQTFRYIIQKKVPMDCTKLADPFKWCLLTMLTLGLHPGAVSLAHFYNDQCGRLLEILTEAADYGDRFKKEPKNKVPWVSRLLADMDLWEKVIGQTGGAIHSKLDLPGDKTYHRRILVASELERKFERKDMDPWQRACDNMTSIMSWTRCAYPLCNESFIGTGSKFQYCGGCKRAPYCSVDHQRSDVCLPPSKISPVLVLTWSTVESL